MTLLAPMLQGAARRHPEIMIELDTTQELPRPRRGRSRHRAAQSPMARTRLGVVGRRLCADDWTLYCSRDYAARHGVPKPAQLKKHAFIGGGGPKLWRAY